MSSNSLKVVKPAKVNTIFIKSLYIKWNVSFCDRFFLCKKKTKYWYSLFGDSENRGKNYLKIRDLLSIVLFNILGTHYSIHI
jgi:hypothetical protein